MGLVLLGLWPLRVLLRPVRLLVLPGLLQRLLRLLAGLLPPVPRLRVLPRQRLAPDHRGPREDAGVRRRVLRGRGRRLRRDPPAAERAAGPPRHPPEARGIPHPALQGVR